MTRSLLIVALLAEISLGAERVALHGATIVPSTQWTLPQRDGQKWAERVRTAVRDDRWKVEINGNDIVASRNEPVAMVQSLPNGPANAKPTPDGEQVVRFTLRFRR